MKTKGPTRIELSVRVSDDSFESRLDFPVDATSEQIHIVVQSWLGALKSAIEINAGNQAE